MEDGTADMVDGIAVMEDINICGYSPLIFCLQQANCNYNRFVPQNIFIIVDEKIHEN